MRLGLRKAGVLAILAMLLHAGLLVRHHVGMVGSYLAHADIVSSLGVICHGSERTTADGSSELPSVPAPAHDTGCPLCASGCAVVAILPERIVLRAAELPVSLRLETVAEVIVQRLVHLRPPTRGPPLIG